MGSVAALVVAERAAAAPTVPCTRVGQRVIAGGYVYVCVRVKGQLRWRRRGRAPETATGVEPDPAASPSATGSSSPVTVDVAALAGLPQGRAVVVAATDGQGRPAEYVLVRDDSRVRAFDARCTHSGCIVAVEWPQLTCFCHSSAFDGATGARLSGPAPRGLAELPASVVGGRVLVTTT